MKYFFSFLFMLMVAAMNAQTDSIAVLKERLKLSGLNLNVYNQRDSTRHLFLSKYQDSVFPNDVLQDFPNLKSLHLYYYPKYPDTVTVRRIIIDTAGLNSYKNLKEVSFSSYIPENLPGTGIFADSLQTLYLNGSQLDSVPDVLYHYRNLQNLNLADNNISALSDKISLLSNLTILDICDNAFLQFPRSIESLKKIKYLSLGRIAPAEDYGSAKYTEEIDFVKRLAASDSLIRLHLFVGSSAEKRFLKRQIQNDTNRRKIFIYNSHPWWMIENDSIYYHIRYTTNLSAPFDAKGAQRLFSDRSWPTIKPAFFSFSLGADVTYKRVSAGVDFGFSYGREFSNGDSSVVSSMTFSGVWLGVKVFSIKRFSFDVSVGSLMFTNRLEFSYIDSTLTVSEYLDNTSNSFTLFYSRDYFAFGASLKYADKNFEIGLRQNFLLPSSYGTWKLNRQELINDVGGHIRYYGQSGFFVAFRIPVRQ
ncbi:MAG: leucine-rich repeat domain-containing protein [Bacteroidales bacterium]|jgi:hypothetical protein|nr:leucine-rich repeat domain-containing protein [Bacteroidales bacterium]